MVDDFKVHWYYNIPDLVAGTILDGDTNDAAVVAHVRAATLDPAEAERRIRLMAAAPSLFEALAMVRDADEDCKKDGLPTIPPVARAMLDAALVRASLEECRKGMGYYWVFLRAGQENLPTFYCWARDLEHAKEQALAAYPGAEVTEVVRVD